MVEKKKSGLIISKVVISLSSKKLVNQAHAIVIYYESKKDLEKLKNLIEIYKGVPLKLYFGNHPYDNVNPFFDYGDPSSLVKALEANY